MVDENQGNVEGRQNVEIRKPLEYNLICLFGQKQRLHVSEVKEKRVQPGSFQLLFYSNEFSCVARPFTLRIGAFNPQFAPTPHGTTTRSVGSIDAMLVNIHAMLLGGKCLDCFTPVLDSLVKSLGDQIGEQQSGWIAMLTCFALLSYGRADGPIYQALRTNHPSTLPRCGIEAIYSILPEALFISFPFHTKPTIRNPYTKRPLSAVTETPTLHYLPIRHLLLSFLFDKTQHHEGAAGIEPIRRQLKVAAHIGDLELPQTSRADSNPQQRPSPIPNRSCASREKSSRLQRGQCGAAFKTHIYEQLS
ncbi:hypothetical protein BX600DRAFT_440161 [Xylariales sp. PMI_506]|nr:hypothetical protein BX600DRAFT_440161 [Xylariales sp. PMI_506]